MAESGNLIEIRGLTKSYPGVTALDSVDFTVQQGETHVLVGENGAGKTTLVKVLCGATKPDSFETFRFNGHATELKSPQDAIKLGVAAIQQQFSLVEQMTVAENIFLGREFSSGLRPVDRDAMERKAREILSTMGVDINPKSLVSRLDMSHQQVVEISKALSQEPRLLIMDEPTSGLTREETFRLFEIIKKLKERGITILYISHRLEEVFEVGDRVTVLRNGRKVHEGRLAETSHAQLTQHIIGRELGRRYPKQDLDHGEVILSLQRIGNSATKPQLHEISFDVRTGEIVALYGILGCGKDELGDTLFGRAPATEGSIMIDGREVSIRTPSDAIRYGMGYLTANRHEEGLVELMSLRTNLSLPSLEAQFSHFGRLDEKREHQVAQKYMTDLQLHAPHTEIQTRNLSGGNQQKVVFGKWLLTQARLLILNEPTKGIDVGSKVQMFELMTQAAKRGAAVVFMTAEAEEAFEMGDQILVMRNGRVAARYERRQIVENQVSLDEVLRVATAREADETVAQQAAGTT